MWITGVAGRNQHEQENADRPLVSSCVAQIPSVLLSFDGRDVQNGQSLRDMVAAVDLSGKGMGSSNGDGEGEMV